MLEGDAVRARKEDSPPRRLPLRAIDTIARLVDAGATITAFDPEGMEVAAPLMPDVIMAGDAYDAAKDADVVVIVTEWDAFRALDLARLGGGMNDKLLVDLRNIYPRDEVARHGFRHIAIGTSGE